jgi:DNA-binding LacI/PurR family transcriptional regulator
MLLAMQGAEERPSDDAEERRSDDAEERRSDDAEERRSDGAEERPSDDAEERRSDDAEERRSDDAEERRSDGAEERPSDDAEERGSDDAEERPSDDPEESPSGARAVGRDPSSGRARKRTLRDVAAEAGVSIGTASNAFNRPELISDALRDRVLEAATRLGYGGPDPAARRLRTGRTGALGLIFTDRLPYAFDDEAAVLFLRGLANALENSGAGLLLIPTSPTREEGSRVVSGAAVDGFIVFSCPTGDPRLEAALARGLPAITVDEPFDVPTPFIGIDERGGAEAAGRHLTDLGHRRVAVISFPMYADDDEALPFDVSRERLAGYREGLGAAFEPDLVFTAPTNHPDTGRGLAAEILRVAPTPTAVLAMSDALATGVVRGALEAGLKVPEDLSVVGFDDIPLAGLTEPPLTTVAQPVEHKGELTAHAMLRALEEAGTAGEPQRTILPTELVVRGTTGPPPR